MNFTTTHIRSEKVTVDTRIYTVLEGGKKSGKVYLAAIAPDMELTVITLDEAPGILPCFDESDAYLSVLDTSLLLSYNPAQVLKFAGKQYLTGAVILLRANMDGNFISLTIDEIYRFQKYLESHSVTLMVDNQKLTCICIDCGVSMKEFEVEITETLQRTVVIRAGSRAEAEVLAEEMWNNEEFVLGAEDFVGAEFSAVSEKEITPKCRKRKDEMER